MARFNRTDTMVTFTNWHTYMVECVLSVPGARSRIVNCKSLSCFLELNPDFANVNLSLCDGDVCVMPCMTGAVLCVIVN